MNEQQFKDRTKKLALRVIRLVEALPKRYTSEVIDKQLLRSATSVGANYRVEEEADESLYWMELLIEAGLMPKTKLSELMAETNELVAMTVASIKTLRTNQLVNPKFQNSKIPRCRINF